MTAERMKKAIATSKACVALDEMLINCHKQIELVKQLRLRLTIGLFFPEEVKKGDSFVVIKEKEYLRQYQRGLSDFRHSIKYVSKMRLNRKTIDDRDRVIIKSIKTGKHIICEEFEIPEIKGDIIKIIGKNETAN